MRVALRADASAAIGRGHVARCVALAHALRDAGAEPVLVWRRLGVDLGAWLRTEGLDSIDLPAPGRGPAPAGRAPYAGWAGVDEDRDAADTAGALRAIAPVRVVVDHYAFGARWHRAVAAALGARIAAIDDLADRALETDVVIDPNHADDHALKFRGRTGRDATILGGPRHALLAPAYADPPRCSPGARVRSVGVFMGGADAAGLSAVVLDALELAGFDGEVEVAATSSSPTLGALREAIARRPRARLLLDAPDLAAFFARHDLQVGAGGGATWERCRVGAPTLAAIVADNQRPVLGPLAARGVVAVVDAVPPTVEAFARGLRPLLADAALRARLSAEGRALVDGRGAARVAHRIVAG